MTLLVIVGAFVVAGVLVTVLDPVRPWRPSIRDIRRTVRNARDVLTPAADGTVLLLDLIDAHNKVCVLLGQLGEYPPTVRERHREEYDRLLDDLDDLEVRLGARLGVRRDGKMMRD